MEEGFTLNLKQVQQELEKARKRVADLEATERTIIDFNRVFSKAVSASREREAARATRAPEALQKIISENPARGMRLEDIRAQASHRFGIEISNKSASNAFTRFKKEGIVERRGYLWYLKGHAPQEKPDETPDPTKEADLTL